jgi:tetraacyldisaccharide 4'-kinase
LVELLRAPAALFALLSTLRRRAYDGGLLPSARLAVPVISVGNLTAGGTGKTPFVALLVAELRRRGLRPGVLSRGYHADSAAKGKGADSSPGSDEARMLASQLGACEHVEDPDRIRGGQRLVEAGVDVIVLDDGFQHRRLTRDLDIVLMDATRPFGLPAPPEGGAAVRAFLPRGLLREGLAALARAQAVVLTRTDQAGEAALEELRAMVGRAAPGMAIMLGEHRPVALVAPAASKGGASGQGDSRRLTLETLPGVEVDLVSAIGNPQAFEATVRGLGARVCDHRRFQDHHAYKPGDLVGLGQERPLLTTAKDRVKLPPEAPVHVLEVEFSLTAGMPVLAALLDSLPPSEARAQRAALHEGLHG